MITEDYVSFETAKLLKEKGFDVSEIDAYFPFVYYSDGKLDFYDDDNPLFVCEAVTLQMAMKWLMKNHNICIVSLPVVTDDDGEAGCLWNYIISRKLEVLHKSEYLYESPEIALNDAIKYCLEHLI